MSRCEYCIEVGEYVRTIYGEIFKVTHLSKQKIKYVVVDKEVDRNEDRAENDNVLNITEITKHSKNIIDLIEVGDYVNGSRVIEVDNCKGAMREIYLEGQDPEKDCGIYFEQIETILTHEQYKQNCYKVGDIE